MATGGNFDKTGEDKAVANNFFSSSRVKKPENPNQEFFVWNDDSDMIYDLRDAFPRANAVLKYEELAEAFKDEINRLEPGNSQLRLAVKILEEQVGWKNSTTDFEVNSKDEQFHSHVPKVYHLLKQIANVEKKISKVIASNNDLHKLIQNVLHSQSELQKNLDFHNKRKLFLRTQRSVSIAKYQAAKEKNDCFLMELLNLRKDIESLHVSTCAVVNFCSEIAAKGQKYTKLSEYLDEARKEKADLIRMYESVQDGCDVLLNKLLEDENDLSTIEQKIISQKVPYVTESTPIAMVMPIPNAYIPVQNTHENVQNIGFYSSCNPSDIKNEIGQQLATGFVDDIQDNMQNLTIHQSELPGSGHLFENKMEDNEHKSFKFGKWYRKNNHRNSGNNSSKHQLQVPNESDTHKESSTWFTDAEKF